MAKNGFKLIDAEMHVMEPTDLWQRYIDPEFRARAPRRLDERRWDIRTLVEGEVMAQIPGGDWPALSDAEEKALAERYAEEIARNFDPESQIRAMDKEGLDLAILFPTSAMYVTAFTRMDARFAAAACRAYNDWLYDYIQAADPKRMFGAAAGPAHGGQDPAPRARRAPGAARRPPRPRAPPRRRRARHEGRVPAPQHLQRASLARSVLRPALGGLPGAERPGRISRNHRLTHEGGGR